MKLEMTQKQELKLTPQMLQSMELLQMSAQELEAYLRELVQENPAAELSEPEERQDGGEELWRRMQSLADQDNQNRQYVAAGGRSWTRWPGSGRTADWRTPFCSICPGSWGSQAPTLVLQGAQFLAACLDESGYLRRKWKTWPRRPDCLPRCWRRGAEPAPDAGPGGRGRAGPVPVPGLQLRRAGEEGPPLLCRPRGLERLARRQYRALAQELGVSQQEVLQAEARIRALDPRPGAAFAPGRSRSIWSPTWVVLQGKTGWRSICRRAICRGSASAAATVICTGTIRTRRSAGIWTERSVRSSGPSRRWSSAEPPAPLRPGAGPAAAGVFRVPVAAGPCVWPT